MLIAEHQREAGRKEGCLKEGFGAIVQGRGDDFISVGMKLVKTGLRRGKCLKVSHLLADAENRPAQFAWSKGFLLIKNQPDVLKPECLAASKDGGGVMRVMDVFNDDDAALSGGADAVNQLLAAFGGHGLIVAQTGAARNRRITAVVIV